MQGPRTLDTRLSRTAPLPRAEVVVITEPGSPRTAQMKQTTKMHWTNGMEITFGMVRVLGPFRATVNTLRYRIVLTALVQQCSNALLGLKVHIENLLITLAEFTIFRMQQTDGFGLVCSVIDSRLRRLRRLRLWLHHIGPGQRPENPEVGFIDWTRGWYFRSFNNKKKELL